MSRRDRQYNSFFQLWIRQEEPVRGRRYRRSSPTKNHYGFAGHELLLLLFFFPRANVNTRTNTSMEQPPHTQEMTPEQIQERLAQIDKALFTLTDSLNSVPAESQESTQGDDDALESELVEQKLGDIRSQIEELQRERDQLHQLLAKTQETS